MFSATAKFFYQNVPGSEGNALKNFLENSDELKKMRAIALAHQTNICTKMINDIGKALTFAEILKITERFDFTDTRDSTVKTLGPVLIKSILFFSGFVNNQANFGYFAAIFREKAIKVMAENGYKAEMINPVATAIQRMN